MSRPYSDQFRLSLHKKNPKNIGVRLAKLCVRTNLPSQYVAKIFGVSRMTIYSWFRGGQTSHQNITRIKHFIELVEQDLKSGVFHPGNKEAAKIYLNTNIEPNLIRVLKGGVFRPTNKEKENQKKVSKEEKLFMEDAKAELVDELIMLYRLAFQLEIELDESNHSSFFEMGGQEKEIFMRLTEAELDDHISDAKSAIHSLEDQLKDKKFFMDYGY